MMKIRPIASFALVALVGALLAVGPVQAQQKKLAVGDPAPGLDIEDWVKGKETTIEKGQVYIVEFWATWCGPCKVVMPHMSDTQKTYAHKGLTVIGISNEKADVVKTWMARNGDKMDYTVAVDRRDATTRAWRTAAGLNGIPAAFIVGRDGRIAFIGNPHPKADGPEMDRVLQKVLRGRYDPKLEKQAAPALKAARDARRTRAFRIAEKQYEGVIALNPKVFADVSLELFEMMLVDQADATKAYGFAKQTLMADQFAGDAEALRMLAEKIVLDPDIPREKRDLDLALAASTMAMGVDGRDDPEAHASLALVHFHRGELAEAVRLQRRAWRLVRTEEKDAYRRVLSSYQNAERAGIR